MSKFVFGTAVKELRFHLSQTGEASVPLRKFLQANYAPLKQASDNKVPILVREAFGIPPSFTARFEKGKEIKKQLEGLTEKDIADQVATFIKSS
ncbi:L51/S25/CI-B8 domain-containing protein [Kocuria palustris]|nr:L51/S25/CI-B8 domain-containing protein [Kocuria palustris]